MKRYLICSVDQPVSAWPPQAVLAKTPDEALQTYLRVVYSKDDAFRESVLDLSVNLSFVEQFYLASGQELDRFHSTGVAGTESEIVRSRIRSFFQARPEMGEAFIRYMETEDRSLISDDIFGYIAVHAWDNGFTVLDPDSAPVVAIASQGEGDG